MENIKSFENFLNEADTFDPKKAKDKVKGKDKSPSGLSFPIIKEVFGDDSYALRWIVAQALYLADWDLFQTNSSHPNGMDLRAMTLYIGDKEQNDRLKEVRKEQLLAVKELVSFLLNNKSLLMGIMPDNPKDYRRILSDYLKDPMVRSAIKKLLSASKPGEVKPKTYPNPIP